MAKVYSSQYRLGSLADKVDGSVGTLTNGSFVKGEKGLALRFDSTGYNVMGMKIPAGSSYTIVAYAKPTIPASINYAETIIGNESGGPSQGSFKLVYGWLVKTWTFYYIDSGVAAKISTVTLNSDGKYTCIICTYDSTTRIGTIYVNNLAGVSSTALAHDWIYPTAYYPEIGANRRQDGGREQYFEGEIALCDLYDHVFTESERSQAYKDFLNSHPIEDCKTPDYQAMKPTDLSMEKENKIIDIVSGWNFMDGIWVIATGSSYITDSNTFGASGGGDGIKNPTILFTVGVTYRVRMRLKINVGIQLSIRDYTATNIYLVITGTGNYETIDTTFVVSAIATNGFRFRLTTTSVVDIDYMTIEGIYGLVAAYNFIPNGNTVVDISGNANPITLVGNPVSTKDGISLNGSTNYGTLTNPLLSNVYSVAFTIIPKSNGTLVLFGNNSSSTQFLRISAENSLVHRLTTGGNATCSIAYKVGIKNTFVITRNGTTTQYIYVNGIKYTMTLASNEIWSVSRLGITSNITEPYVYKGEFCDLRFYNRQFTDQEAKDYHNQFAKRITLQESFKDEGADGVSKVPSGWSKVSGTWKIGEHQTSLTEYAPFASLTPSNGWAKVGSTFVYTTNAAHSYISRVTCLTTGKNYKLSFRCVANPNGTAFRASTSLNYSGIFFNMVPVANTVYTYQGSAYVTTGISLQCTTGEPSGLIIDNISVTEIPPLPTFTNGTKYLECVTAGVLVIPSKQAYGTWEFDWYKGADSNALLVYLINSNAKVPDSAIGAYRAYFTNAEKFEFSRHNLAAPITLLSTAAAYLTINTWYRVKITRTLAGVWTAYIKGGAFGNNTWTTISVAGGSGTNPVTDNTYTTSEYILVQSTGAGDRVTNFVLKEGIEV